MNYARREQNSPMGTVDERESLRKELKAYKPGKYIKDLQRYQILPPALLIGLFGSIGAGKSALTNTLLSATEGSPPCVFAATQAYGKHGTLEAKTFPLTEHVKVVDTRGLEKMSEDEQAEVARLLDGRIVRNSRIYRRKDDEWARLSFWKRIEYKLKSLDKVELEMNMVFLLIDITTDYNSDCRS